MSSVINDKRINIFKKIVTISLLLVFLFSLFNIGKALAKEPTFELVNATITEKSDNVDASILSFDNNELSTDVEFHRIGDYVTYVLTIKNTSNKEYQIKLVTDNSGNNNVEYEYIYDENEKLQPNGTVDVVFKATYKDALEDITKRTQDKEFDVIFTIVDEDGNIAEDEIDVNPKTHDNIMIYIVTGLVSIALLICILVTNRKVKASLVVMLLISPIITKAITPSLIIKLNSQIKLFDKIVVSKEINGEEVIEVIDYGTKPQKPSDPEIPGYEFVGWYLGDKEYNFDTDITDDTEITAKFNLIEYTIEYELNGGTATGNRTSYNVETDSFDLINPTKDGYVFSGWTGSNGTNLQTRVTITKGTTGDKSFVANYSLGQETEYTVYHKYKKLNGDFETEEEKGKGETNSTVTPALREKYGFNNPALQELTILPDGSASIEYIYTRKEYTLTLQNSEDIETTFTDSSYLYETEITLKAKDKEHYTFEKWSNNETSNPLTFKLTENTSIYPIYALSKYTVTFDSQGGVEVGTIEKEYNSEIGTLPETTKPNYDFGGWYTDTNYTTEVTSTTKVLGNVTYYAKWTPTNYTVTFETNGGSAVSSITRPYDTEIGTLPDTNKEHYSFDGWFEDITYTTLVTTTTKVLGNVTYYAKWTPLNYTVTFDSQGGSSADSITKPYDTEIGTLPETTKEHYIFGGWFTDTNYETEVTSATKVLGNTTYYAKWTPVNYTITFETNGGSSVAPVTKPYDTEIGTLPETVKEHYTFDGWFEDSTYTTEVTSTTKVLGNTTYYAKWTPFNYTVSFDTQGGSPVASVLKAYDTAMGTLPETTKDHNTFAGWFTNTNYETEVTTDTKILGDVTFFAKWIINNHTITFDSQGGTPVESITRAYDTELGTLPETYKEHYILSGWWTNTNYETEVTSTTKVLADATYYAKWTPANYTVTFDSQGGSEVAPITKPYDTEIGTLPEATKEHYSLVGWYVDTTYTTEVTSTTKVLGNVTYFAKWAPVDYTVTFDTQGGSEVSSITRTYDTEIGTLPETTKEHYTFGGWFTDTNYETEVTSATKVLNNVTYYAKWIPVNYTITFDSQEGSSVDPITKPYDTEIGTLPESVREHYSLDGWYTDTTYETKVTPTAKVLGNATYYAKWVIDTHTITFETNGGSPVSSITRDYNSEIGTLPDTTKEHYSFDGWFEDITYTTLVTTTTKVLGDTTYYAKWTPLNYTVTFDAQGGSEVSSITKPYDTEIGTLPETVKEHNTFGGWFTDTNYTTEVTSTTKVLGNTTYYAKWIIDTHTISFETNGGSPIDSITKDYNSEVGTLPESTKDNYTFAGWYEDSTLTTIVTPTTKVLGDTTYYAKWTPVNYTVTFDSQGGSSVDSITKPYDTEIGTLPEPTKENNTFAGWFTDTNWTTQVTSTTKVLGNVTYYAKWTTTGYTVTFDSQGGSTVPSVTVPCDSEIGTLPEPTKDNLVFMGWFTDTTYETEVTEDTIVAADVTYYALWKSIICEKATTLNSEPCTKTDSRGCKAAGYAQDEIITYGRLSTGNTYQVGDAFNCDVNGDNDYDPATERFYYLRTVDNHAVLIYNYNVSEGNINLSNAYAYNAEKKNYISPTGLISHMPTTTQWRNVSLTSSTHQILNDVGGITYKNGDLPIADYTGHSARMATKQDIPTSCGTALENCEFLYENTSFSRDSTDGLKSAYWLESPTNNSDTTVLRVVGSNRAINTTNADSNTGTGVRPAIEVPIKLMDTSTLDVTTYTITFDPNGGSVDPTSKVINEGDSLSQLPTPTRENYMFDGWWTDVSSGTQVDEDTIPDTSTTYYARWTANINNATINLEEVNLEVGETEQLTITGPSGMEEYTIVSNNEFVVTIDNTKLITATGAGTTTITITGNRSNVVRTIDVVVTSTADTYTITFDSQGGEEVPSKAVAEDTTAGTLPSPTRYAYLFDGWYTDTTYETEFTESTVVTGNITVYAKWNLNAVAEISGNYYETLQDAVNAVPNKVTTTITVLKNATGLTSIVSNQYVDLDLNGFTLSNNNSNVLKNSGRLTVHDGTITCSATYGAIDNDGKGILNVVDLTIIATATNKGQAIYNNGGTTTIEGNTIVSSRSGNRAAIHNADGTLIIKGVTATARSQAAVKNDDTDKDSLIIGVEDGTHDTTGIILQGKTYGVETASEFSFYDGILKGATDPVNDINYLTTTEDSVEEVNGSELIETTTYKTLYYEVQPGKYRIDFDANSGSVTPNHKFINIGDSVGTLPTPSHTLYTFDGWWTAPDGGSEISTSTIPSGSTTYYAHWSYTSSNEIEEFNITNSPMTTYYSNIATWKTDVDNFQSTMLTNFNNNNCKCKDGTCSTSGTVLCDKPNAYNTLTNQEVNVYLSDEITKEKGALVTYTMSDSGLIYNMIPGVTYKWELVSDSNVYGYVKAVGNRRIIDGLDVGNIRDLGGMQVDTDGDGTIDGTLKYGVLFRGEKLGTSTTIVNELENLGVNEEIDLRAASERGSNEVALTNFKQREIKHYQIDQASYPSNYTLARNVITETMQDVVAGNSIYFHCRIGADRTGTLAYILEGLLGVPDEERLQDYELSVFSGLVNRHRYYSEDPNSSVSKTEKFVYMYNFMKTNNEIYDWYMQGSTDTVADNTLINNFRTAMIQSN